eukprot:SM000029S10523  [mRNA]  locus=s29:641097:647685:+ [translate_table: standard]
MADTDPGAVQALLHSCRQSGNQILGSRGEGCECGGAGGKPDGGAPFPHPSTLTQRSSRQAALCEALIIAGIRKVEAMEEGGPGNEKRQLLTLLELPSIFVPEAWSFTFFEGISRHQDTGFRGRDVVELGCGNGWVTLAMAARYCPRKASDTLPDDVFHHADGFPPSLASLLPPFTFPQVYGLDINPRAIKVAWINLYLNGLSPEGNPVVDAEGMTMLDRVEFHESDLLAHCRDHHISLDRVVGCIPQVLSPDPEAMLNIVSETMTDEFLHSLSNYCGAQGFVEDQFGLGLIARAVEEAIQVVRPSGCVILNMGGRPGMAVCERLFLRRGFNIRKLWQTRVNQAADTDILALVEIERSSRHRFEFYMGPVSEEPVSAKTAYAFARAGGSIGHGLTVFECRLRHPTHVKQIFQFLKQDGYGETRGALDLAFHNDGVADEKTAFLAHLASTLPSSLPSSSLHFRSQFAAYLRLYFRVPYTAQNLVVLPSRGAALENIVRLYAPRLALVDATLARLLPRHLLQDDIAFSPKGKNVVSASSVRGHEEQHGMTLLEAPRSADLLLQLTRALRPQVMVLQLADFEMRSTIAFEQLLQVSKEVGARIFVDISDHLELSSLPSTNGVLQYLAEHPLPPHAAIICGLVKNQVYSDLEVCLLISENASLLRGTANMTELTFSVTPAMSQLYYGTLLHELLSFQLRERHQLNQRTIREEDDFTSSQFVAITRCAAEACQFPSVSSAEGPSPLLGAEEADHQWVRMDEAECHLAAPRAATRLVFEGFARQHVSEAEMDPRPEILQLLSERLGLIPGNAKEVVLGQDSGPLFYRLMAACHQEGATALLPSGFPGSWLATAALCQVSWQVIATLEESGYKLLPGQLETALVAVPRAWVVLTAPIVNPTGAVYTSEELVALLGVCRRHGARVIIDTSYMGLQWDDFNSCCDLEGAVASMLPKAMYAVAILGSVSKLFSAGGLRLGFAVLRDNVFIDALKERESSSLCKPHGTLRYAAKRMMALQDQYSDSMQSELRSQLQELKRRADLLCQTLSESGWAPLRPAGGLFLVARPVAFEGKAFRCAKHSDVNGRAAMDLDQLRDTANGKDNIEQATYTLDSKNIRDVMRKAVGLIMNCSDWTGIPNHCRFVFSGTEDAFTQGLRRIRQFHAMVLRQTGQEET